MTDKIEIKGKTVDAAVSEALLQLGARRDEVEIKVLEEPKSGFMGFLGGRAARVLVRKKPSRGRGGSQDHRVDDEDYKAHNLSGGGGRGRRGGGSGRKPSRDNGGRDGQKASGGRGGQGNQGGQGSQNNRNEARGDGKPASREDRGGTRRGSRGRGGRGRSQGAAAREGRPDQGTDQNQSQNQSQSQPANQSRNQDQAREKPQARGGRSRNERGRRGPDTRAEARVDQPNGNTQETVAPRPAEERPAAKADNGRNRRREAPIPAPVETAAPPVTATQPENKEVPSVSTPPKQRRAFGGLGAKIKAKRAAEKAAKEAAANPPAAPAASAAPATEAPRPAPSVQAPDRREPSRSSEPRYDRRPSERSGSSYGSGSADEIILEGIEAQKYATAVARVTEDNLDDTLTELTDAMLARAGFPCRCETQPGEYRQIKVTTDDASAGMLIGRHGQTIEAVEHLVERMASNAIDARARINLDINNYRQRREESLEERVKEAADKIKETGKAVHLEPMSARERRIVHMYAADFGGLRTFTMDGSGGKHVVIAADEEAAPANDTPADEQE